MEEVLPINTSDAILTVAVEGLAVGILTLIAGISDGVGSIVITFMAGLWIMFMIANSGVVSSLANTTGNIQKLSS